jgi:hypothetical protein
MNDQYSIFNTQIPIMKGRSEGRVRGIKVYYINGKTIPCDRNNIDFMIFECKI